VIVIDDAARSVCNAFLPQALQGAKSFGAALRMNSDDMLTMNWRDQLDLFAVGGRFDEFVRIEQDSSQQQVKREHKKWRQHQTASTYHLPPLNKKN
jgi:hypothetical protein